MCWSKEMHWKYWLTVLPKSLSAKFGWIVMSINKSGIMKELESTVK